MSSHPPKPVYSDARYIFIFFALIFVVFFFAFLIYFVYGQKQFIAEQRAETDFSKVGSRVVEPSQVISESASSPNIVAVSSNPPTNVPVPVVEPVPTANPVEADISRYNPRTAESLKIYGRDFLHEYFGAITRADYQYACSLLSNTLCNARRDIYSFSQFLSKTVSGYTVQSITLAKEQKPSESIYCVQYTYSLKADLNPIPVTEIFQYRIKKRPDGGDEISARVCEKIIKDGRERPCPIITPKKYCV